MTVWSWAQSRGWNWSRLGSCRQRSGRPALAPDQGLVTVGGDDIAALGSKRLAQRMGVVLQERDSDFDFAVRDVVLMGRSSHKRILDRESAQDRAIVADILGRLGLVDLAERNFSSLSGGERQRVLIARCLAQQARYLVLDEPTNHLDIRYQLEVMDLVTGLGVTVIAALHDLNIAAASCDRVHVLAGGRVVAAGPPGETLTPDLVAEVFGVRAEVLVSPHTGRVHLAYRSRRS